MKQWNLKLICDVSLIHRRSYNDEFICERLERCVFPQAGRSDTHVRIQKRKKFVKS